MNDCRLGARLIRDVLNEVKAAVRRRPTPVEVVTAAYTRARDIIAAESLVGNYSTKMRRSALAGAGSTGEPTYYAADIQAAREVLELFAILGDNTPTRVAPADAEHRERARCSAIMTGLREHYPDLFGNDVRVVANRHHRWISDHAKSHAAKLAPLIIEIAANGVTTLSGIARELNERAVPAANGGAWHAKQVSRVLAALPMAA